MKKHISTILLIFVCLLVGCSKTKNEVLTNYTEVDNYFNIANKNEFKGYYFIDVREKSIYVLGHRKSFVNIYTLKGLKNYIEVENIKKNNFILLMGQNESDNNLEEFFNYLVSNGYRNVKKYVGGYDDYLTKDNFIPVTGNDDVNCDC